MARTLVLGNGALTVALDHRGLVRDIFFPYVGLEHHTLGHPQRVGVFVDGKISWLDDQDWDISVDYLPETMIGSINATNSALALNLVFHDLVYNERNIFLRNITVENRAAKRREIKLFFHHDLAIAEHALGVTAFFYPSESSIIHYHGNRVFLINGRIEKRGIDDYTTGMIHYQNLEGTWRDAEDGILARNAIEHGQVDSTVAFRCHIPAKSSVSGFLWLCAGSTLEEVCFLNRDVLKRTPEHLFQTTRDFWSAWVNKQHFSYYGMTSELIDLFKTSLLVLRAHADNRGAILASVDSEMLQFGKDTYSYMWPRDAAYTALACVKAGYPDIAKRFFELCARLLTAEGYMMHKYMADGSLGSSWHPWVENEKEVLPIQEDETAILLHVLWQYYGITRDIEFIETLYNPFIKCMADFLVRYRHPKTGLPHQSYNLWEETRVVSTYTVATVIAGLRAASQFAQLLGKKSPAKTYAATALHMEKALTTQMFSKDSSCFLKALLFTKDGKPQREEKIDVASILGLVLLEIYPLDDPKIRTSIKAVERLLNQAPIGGLPRYEGDLYFKTAPGAPDNPWIITTLWYAQYLIKIAKKETDLQPVKKILGWVQARALSSGILSEQVHPETGAALSATPLTWSHATFVLAIIEYLEKLEVLGICKACKPLSKFIEDK